MRLNVRKNLHPFRRRVRTCVTSDVAAEQENRVAVDVYILSVPVGQARPIGRDYVLSFHK